MALFRGIQEYIALDANNITLVFDSGNIVNISGNIFLYPTQGHPIAHHRSRVQDPVGTVLSTELPTVDHHDSIKLNVRWCAWKVGEGFPGRVSPKTLKWVAVYSSVTFHIDG